MKKKKISYYYLNPLKFFFLGSMHACSNQILYKVYINDVYPCGPKFHGPPDVVLLHIDLSWTYTLTCN